MQPTTILLPDETQQALQILAQQEGKTLDEIVQQAIQFYVSSTQKKKPQSIGMGKSNRTDLSERVDELLWQDS